MKQEITMGSLFSGSGGFELAGSIFGIRPIWASEIEPYPVETPQQPSSRKQVGTGRCEIWSTAKQKKITGRR